MKTEKNMVEEEILHEWGEHGLHCWKLGYKQARNDLTKKIEKIKMEGHRGAYLCALNDVLKLLEEGK